MDTASKDKDYASMPFGEEEGKCSKLKEQIRQVCIAKAWWFASCADDIGWLATCRINRAVTVYAPGSGPRFDMRGDIMAKGIGKTEAAAIYNLAQDVMNMLGFKNWAECCLRCGMEGLANGNADEEVENGKQVA